MSEQTNQKQVATRDAGAVERSDSEPALAIVA